MAEPTYKLRMQGLRKTYGPVVALAGADVDIREGEFLTLLGPSGSGKTTMLLLIAGLIQPDRGALWIDGKLATYMPPHKRDIGMVFQNYALFPHMTVYENIAFPLRIRRMPVSKMREEVRRVLDIVQLSGVEERLPRQLSGGQQQRIALARCLAYRPPIILMDEPLGALDKKLREQLQLEIRHLHQALDITGCVDGQRGFLGLVRWIAKRALPNDAGGNSDDRRAGRHIVNDDGIGPDSRPVADCDRTDDFRAGADEDVASQARGLLAFGADRHLMLHENIAASAHLPVDHHPLRVDQNEAGTEFGAPSDDA